MAKKLKISVSQTQTIREAFDDFLLQKKALGLADKTIETYSHERGILTDGWRFQSVGTGDDSRKSEVRNGERQSKGEESRQTAHHER